MEISFSHEAEMNLLFSFDFIWLDFALHSQIPLKLSISWIFTSAVVFTCSTLFNSHSTTNVTAEKKG